MITGTFTTAVGDISITMDDGGAGAYVEVSKLGNLKYEFDQTPDSVQIDRTIALYSYIQVVFLSLTESSEDLYTRLVDATATTPIDCTLSIDNFGVDTFDFSFELKQENIDYNEKEGTVAVRFTPRIRSNVLNETVIDQAGTNYVYKAEDQDGNVTNLNCLPVGNYIGEALNRVFDNSFTNYIQSAKTSSNVKIYPEDADLSNGDESLIMVSQSGVNFVFAENDLDVQQGSGTVNVNFDRTLISEYTYAGTGYQDFQYVYYIRQTDILNQVSAGDRIQLFGQQSQTTPLELNISASTQDELVTVVYTRSFIAGTIPIPLNVTDQSLYTDINFFILSGIAIDKAEKTLKELSAATGAIFGTGFSENFFVYRLSDNDSTYITINYEQDVVSIKQKRLNKFINEAVVRQVSDQRNVGEAQFGVINNSANLIIPNLIGAGTFSRLRPSALKSLEINLAPAYPYLNKGTKSASGYLFYNSITASNNNEIVNSDLEKRLTDAALQSYIQALSQENGGLKIEMECLGALTLRPYSLFQFDSTAPEKYQNRQYRISSISYDFIKDTYKVVGYQVSGLVSRPATQPTDPPPDGPPPGNGGGGDNGTDPDDTITTPSSATYKKGWNLIGNPKTVSLFPNTIFGQDYVTGTLSNFSGAYNLVSSINPSNVGDGYWVSIDFNGNEFKTYEWPGDNETSNIYDKSVAKGWNMIAGIGVNAEIQSNTANIFSGTTYSYYTGTYEQQDYLYPGYGYFVNADADGTINIVASSVVSAPVVTNYNETHKQVEIKSGAVQQKVYFDGTLSNANTAIESMQFPPAVAANFDIRINNDETNVSLRDRRVVESNTINIDVQQIDSATTLNISPSIFYYVEGATDASPSHTTNVYTALSGYSLACSCSIYETGSLYYTTGPAPLENFQATFLDGDKIITAQNIVESTPVDVPITTTRITLQPMGANIKLPVRARDIANDDYVLTAKYDRVGTAQTGDASETVIEDSLFAVYDTDNDYKIEIGYRTNIAPVPQIFLDDTAKDSSGANNLQLQYDEISMGSLSDGSYLQNTTTVVHDLNTEEQVVELASFASNQDDYNIGRGTVFTIQTSATPSADITGIAGGVDGRIVHLINRGSRDIIFRHDDSNSAAANRFYFARSGNPIIEEWQTISLRYVAGSINRWIRQEG